MPTVMKTPSSDTGKALMWTGVAFAGLIALSLVIYFTGLAGMFGGGGGAG